MLLRNKRSSEDVSESKEVDKQIEIREIKSERKILSLKSEIEKLTDIIKEKEVNSQQNKKYAELLSELFEKGIIDVDGKFINSHSIINEFL